MALLSDFNAKYTDTMNTKKVEKNEYVTKREFREIVHEIVHGAVEEIGRMMAVGFAGVDKRFQAVDIRFETVDMKFEAIDKRFRAMEISLVSVESDMTTVARKSDITNFYDKFVPYYKYDELSLRVHALEKKSKNA